MKAKEKEVTIVGNYKANLNSFSNSPLHEVLGNLDKPIPLETIQERLWKFINQKHLLILEDKKESRKT